LLVGKNLHLPITLSPDEQVFLVGEWGKRFSPLVQHQLTRAFAANAETRAVRDFVKTLIPLSQDHLKEKEILASLDVFLYEMLPLCPGENWKENALLIVPEKWRKEIEALLAQQPDDLYGFLGSRHLQELAKAFLLLVHQSVQTSVDLHELCAQEARLKKVAPPSPLIFADTNWPHFLFGFVWGAASERLRLWRIDASGISGVVMSEWEPFLRGERQLTWGIYPKSEQYA
jgi:hypothetical protein